MISASSSIIQHIDAMSKTGHASLAIFYCDFREDQKRDLHGLLSSLLVQFSHQSDSYCDVLSEFYMEHAKGSKHPNDDALVKCLKEILKLPEQAPVYLVLDALDECRITSSMPSPREKVLMLLEELINSQIPNLRICITSRPEIDIKAVLDPLTFRFIAKYSTFAAASQDEFGTLWTNYRTRSMRHMSARYEISIKQTGNSPTVFS